MEAMYPEGELMESLGKSLFFFLFWIFMTGEDSILDLIWILKVSFRHNFKKTLFAPSQFCLKKFYSKIQVLVDTLHGLFGMHWQKENVRCPALDRVSPWTWN